MTKTFFAYFTGVFFSFSNACFCVETFVCIQDELKDDGDFRKLELLESSTNKDKFELKYTQRPGGFESNESKFTDVTLAKNMTCSVSKGHQLVWQCSSPSDSVETSVLTEIKPYGKDAAGRPEVHIIEQVRIRVISSELAKAEYHELVEGSESSAQSNGTKAIATINFLRDGCVSKR
ncbi:MAG: hypothetical protein JWQ35_2544 [Bacteriovoracaceae bacterium]|nr:hypothetical protein [Bacteriovoracaceae bacterium]